MYIIDPKLEATSVIYRPQSGVLIFESRLDKDPYSPRVIAALPLNEDPDAKMIMSSLVTYRLPTLILFFGNNLQSKRALSVIKEWNEINMQNVHL